MYNPFGMNTARQGFGQQGFGQSLNFKGLETKLDKLEKIFHVASSFSREISKKILNILKNHKN